MVRKTTWSIVLLLLASVQSLAMTCGVRCALMTMPDHAAVVQNSMPVMEHCGMSNKSESARHVQVSQQCSSGICGDGLAVVKIPEASAERTDIVLNPLADVIFSASVPLPVSKQAWRPPTNRSTTTPSNLDTLLSNLRV